MRRAPSSPSFILSRRQDQVRREIDRFQIPAGRRFHDMCNRRPYHDPSHGYLGTRTRSWMGEACISQLGPIQEGKENLVPPPPPPVSQVGYAPEGRGREWSSQGEAVLGVSEGWFGGWVGEGMKGRKTALTDVRAARCQTMVQNPAVCSSSLLCQPMSKKELFRRFAGRRAVATGCALAPWVLFARVF